MTETVTLALQGKFVQLGADPEAPVLFVLSPDKQSIAITKAERHQSCSVALDASEAADLRDILNALRERESRADDALKPAERLVEITSCHSCPHRVRTLKSCCHPNADGPVWPNRRPIPDSDCIPSWCPLPEEPTP